MTKLIAQLLVQLFDFILWLFGFLDKDNYLTELGQSVLTFFLRRLPTFTIKRWNRELFFVLMGKNVPACVELVIVRDGKVLLTYRKDGHYVGYHTPGTYIAPGETWQETVQRCADGEIKCKVRFIRQLNPSFSHYDSIRFHDLSNLILCEIIKGEPQAGEWFSECPPDLIPEQKKFWPVIAECLKGS